MIKKYIIEYKLIIIYLILFLLLTTVIAFIFKCEIFWFFLKNNQNTSKIISLNILDVFLGFIKVTLIYTLYIYSFIGIYLTYTFILKTSTKIKIKQINEITSILTLNLILLLVLNYYLIIPYIWDFLYEFHTLKTNIYRIEFNLEILKIINIITKIYFINYIILIYLLIYYNFYNKTNTFIKTKIMKIIMVITLTIVLPPIFSVQILILIFIYFSVKKIQNSIIKHVNINKNYT